MAALSRLEPVELQEVLRPRFGKVGPLFTSRFVYTITRKNHRHRRVALVSADALFVTDLEGVVRRHVRLGEIDKAILDGAVVAFLMVASSPQPTVVFEDLAMEENRTMPVVVEAVSFCLDGDLTVAAAERPILDYASFKKGPQYVSPRKQLADMLSGEFQSPPPSDSEASIGVDYHTQALEQQLRLHAERLAAQTGDMERVMKENDTLRRLLCQRASPPATPAVHADAGFSHTAPDSSANGETEEEALRRELDDASEYAAVGLPEVPRYVFIPFKEGCSEVAKGQRHAGSEAKAAGAAAARRELAAECARAAASTARLLRENAALEEALRRKKRLELVEEVRKARRRAKAAAAAAGDCEGRGRRLEGVLLQASRQVLRSGRVKRFPSELNPVASPIASAHQPSSPGRALPSPAASARAPSVSPPFISARG